ncbi:MAG TPA: hypothetical protein VHC97_20515 [Thermoanaerobaculia bacterium]|jgi:hypothetical protein|nr:hypothetical protein [Thermoanaerobaculia bacterium]
MKLSDIPGVDFRDAGNLSLQDPDHFAGIVARMIEDVELAAYTVAKLRMRGINQEQLITLKDLKESVSLIESEVESKEFSIPKDLPSSPSQAPKVAVVDPDKVKKMLRSPIEVAPSAVDFLAQYINYTSIRLLHSAAQMARAEELDAIVTRHFLAYCDHLPYPLNLLCRQAGGTASNSQQDLIKYPAEAVSVRA